LDLPYLVHAEQTGTQAPVTTKDVVLDDRRQGHAVVAVDEGTPQFHRIAPLALVVEPVELIQAGTLVVSP